MCRNYDELAFDIVTHVGGEQNVKSLKHCVTRLRFALRRKQGRNGLPKESGRRRDRRFIRWSVSSRHRKSGC